MTHETMIFRFGRIRSEELRRHALSRYNAERANDAKAERQWSRFSHRLEQNAALKAELRRNREAEVLAALDAGRED